MPNEVHPVLNRYRDGELEPRDQRAAQRRGCDLAGVDRGVARQQTHWEAGDDATQQHHCHVDGLSKTWGGHVTLPPWFGPSVQIFRYQPSDRNKKDSRGSQTVRSTSFGNIQTKLLVDLNICGNSGVTVMHCHMFCQLGNLHSCIKNGFPTGILVRTCCTFLPFLAISNPSPSFRPIFPTFGSFGSFGWGAKACSAAPRQKTRPPKITAPFRPSFETQQSMTGGKAATAAPTPKIMVIKLSWIWMSSACPGDKGLLDRFFGSEKFMASFFEKWERLARGTLGL